MSTYDPSSKTCLFIWILILFQILPLQSDEVDGVSGEDGPFFELDNSTFRGTNLTVHSGSEFVVLDCPVNRLAKYSVSWLKRDEHGILQLLTVDQVVYSSQSKGITLLLIGGNNFQLKLGKLSTRSSGEYQCQISSHPPKILRYNLNVVAPTIEIVDDGDKPLTEKIFKTDSTLELRCRIFFCCFPPVGQERGGGFIGSSAQPPQHVSWFHDKRLLNNDTYRGGISVKSEMRRNDFAVSKLYVANVNRNDSGYYTCAMAQFGKATVLVSVLNGETPAAMQADGQAPHLLPFPHIPLLMATGIGIHGFFQ